MANEKTISLDNLQTFKTLEDAEIDGKLANKQDTLVSGTNIKTINNTSILGSGNINISGGTEGIVDADLSTLSASTADTTKIYRHTGNDVIFNRGSNSETNVLNGNLYINYVYYYGENGPEKDVKSYWLPYLHQGISQGSGTNFALQSEYIDGDNNGLAKITTAIGLNTSTYSGGMCEMKITPNTIKFSKVALSNGSVTSQTEVDIDDISNMNAYQLYSSGSTSQTVDGVTYEYPTYDDTSYFQQAITKHKNGGRVYFTWYQSSGDRTRTFDVNFTDDTTNDSFYLDLPLLDSTNHVIDYFTVVYTYNGSTVTYQLYTPGSKKKLDSSALVTSISSSSTDAQVPSAKCVYDNLATKTYVDAAIQAAITTALNTPV